MCIVLYDYFSHLTLSFVSSIDKDIPSIFMTGGNKSMSIEYERISDYDITTLRLNNQNEYQIGFFGRRYKDYLKGNHKIIYYNLLTKQQLLTQIKLVEEEANELYESLIDSLKYREKVDEKLKANDPIRWVQMMNNIQNTAREIVLAEVVYR